MRNFKVWPGAALVVAAGAMLVGAAPAKAADGSGEEPMCAKRPGQGEPPCTVQNGHWQLEVGVADWTHDKQGSSSYSDLDLGEIELIYGLTDASHVSVSWTAWQHNRSRDGTGRTSQSGIGNVSLNYKYRMTEKSAAFSAAIAPSVELPTQKREFGVKKAQYSLGLPLSYSFPNSQWSLSAEPKISRSPSSSGYHWAYVQTASVGLQATKPLNLGLEYYRKWAFEEPKTKVEELIEPNFSYAITKDVMIDGSATFGLNKNTADIELQGGVSVRF